MVFVHGCFWHRHAQCRRTTTPTRRRAFWVAKFRANRARDQRCTRLLKRQGWKVAVVWECETTNRNELRARLARLFATRSVPGTAIPKVSEPTQPAQMDASEKRPNP